MKTNSCSICFLIISILVSGCGPRHLLGPTITPSPASTPTPTIIPSPTSTSIPTATLTPTPSCSVENGEWSGNGISFKISNCTITSTSYLFNDATGRFYFVMRDDQIVILDNKFNLSKKEGNGDYLVSGVFDSNSHAHGKATWTKGYTLKVSTSTEVVTLTEDVTFEWEASLEK